MYEAGGATPVPIHLMNAIGLLVSLREMVSELGGAASRSALSSMKKTRAAGDESAARTRANLPVPVTEFAGFCGNCCKWGADAAVDELIVSEVDALEPAFVLTREASASPLMQHVLAAVNALEGAPDASRAC